MEQLFKRLLEYYQIDENEYQKLIAPVDEDNFAMAHTFKDIDKCVEVVRRAIDEKKNIFIYGDYDCDGIMSISILVKMFSYLSYRFMLICAVLICSVFK